MLLSGFYNVVKPPEDMEKEIKAACENSESAVTDLMIVVKKCITEISKEYRKCIEKQIEITTTATEMGPVGAHWDDLTKYRVQAEELKHELTNYQNLMKTLGQIAYDQSMVSFMSGAKENLSLLSEKFAKIDELVKEELQENQKYEMKLLSVHRESILKGGGKLKHK